MNSQELLLSKRWILKSDNRDQYYRIKDDAKTLKKLFQDTLGYSLITNAQFIKLDKVPGVVEPWMGITQFKNKQEYQMLCYILVFLEDKDTEEQFILSHLTEFLAMKLHVDETYWLIRSNRRMFVNVVEFCKAEQLFIEDDGHSENFIKEEDTEALFENTGLSRYFMRSFVSDIFHKKLPSEFMNDDWIGLENDRGKVRSQRVYRRLLLSPGVYKDKDENDDFTYIRHYRKRIENELNQICPCDLQVYKSSAYLVLDEDSHIGEFFLKNNTMDELVVLILSQLRKRVKNGDHKRNEDEIFYMPKDQLINVIKNLIRKNNDYLPSTYRKKKIDILTEELVAYMLRLGFIVQSNLDIKVYPIAGKYLASYEEE